MEKSEYKKGYRLDLPMAIIDGQLTHAHPMTRKQEKDTAETADISPPTENTVLPCDKRLQR